MTAATSTPDLMENDLRGIAIHEAGHAVAHVRLRIDQTSVTVIANGNTLGSANADDSVMHKEDAEEHVLSLCAGYAACRALGHTEDEARHGCWDDFSKAEDLIQFWELGALDDWLQKALEFCVIPENTAAIRRVADGLMEHKTLGAGYVDLLVDLSDGKITETEFLDWHQKYVVGRGVTPKDI